MESGADITLVYNRQEIPQAFKNPNVDIRDMYFTLDVNGEGRVGEIHMNSVQPGVQNLGMNIFVLERELLISLIDEAYLKGQSYFERDVLAPKTGQLHMQGYCYDGYVARINDMQSYFKENMKLLVKTIWMHCFPAIRFIPRFVMITRPVISMAVRSRM